MNRFLKFRLMLRTHRSGRLVTVIAGAQTGAQMHDLPVARTPDPVRRFHGKPVRESSDGESQRDGRDHTSSHARRATESPPAKPQGSRLAGIVAVTAIEALSIYAWLRLHEAGHPWWGLLVLIIGEALETNVLQRFVDRGGVRRWGEPARAAATGGHLRKMQRIVGIAGNVEIAIWVAWLACAHAFGQTIAAVALLVAMHLKHQIETSTICDLPFRKGLFSFKGLFGSAMEVAGAVACLAFILKGQFELAAAAIGVGLLIEHWLLIDVLTWEITTRDIRVPRDPRWRRPARRRPAVAYASTHFPRLWRLVQRSPRLVRYGNRKAINSVVARIEPRPNPLSTMGPYTSWASLTDKSFSSRHLPPAPRTALQEGLPPSAAAASLFQRGEEMVPCPKSTVLFSFFAQWFTDGILRTQRDGKTKDGRIKQRDTLKNESNHDVDLAQLYGLDRDATDQLRGERGLLLSQVINGEEYPPYYHHAPDGPGTELKPDPRFDKLPPPLLFGHLDYEQKRTLFAMGTDTRNIGFISMNVLFLREHNRIARKLGKEYPQWNSDQVFETTRNILIVVLLKIVVEDYINHINPTQFKFRLLERLFPNEPWHRPNHVAVEFNLLYRWHALVPSTFYLGGEPLAISQLVSDTGVLTSAGLGQLLVAASSQPAGRMSLFNTDSFLVDMAEKPSIEQGRLAELASYNDYRRLCRHTPAASFADISSDPEIQQELADLYPGGVEDVEFYVGLNAEDAGPNDVLPPLMMTMVTFDAFSQALTNPLLGPRVFQEATFSAVGMKIIEDTASLSDLVHRNVPRGPGERLFVSMTQRDYKRS